MADPPPPPEPPAVPPAQPDQPTFASSATAGTAGGSTGQARPALLSIRGAASAGGSPSEPPPCVPPPPPATSSAATRSATTGPTTKPVTGQKRPRFSFALAQPPSSSSSTTTSPKSPSKPRVSSGSGAATVGKDILAGLKGKEKEREKGEVDEEDIKALEELKRATVGSGSSTSPKTTRATRTPSLPPRPILDPASPPPPPPVVQPNKDLARRVSEGNSYLDKMRNRERSASASGGREEGEEGEVSSRSGEREQERETWRAADERPSGSSGYADGHERGYGHGRDHGYGNGYARGDRNWDMDRRDRRDSHSGPFRPRYDAPREHRGGMRNDSRPEYGRQQYASYADQGGLPYDGLPEAPAPSRRHDDRRRDRDDYGRRDERRGDHRDDRWDDYRRDRRDDRRGDDRSSSTVVPSSSRWHHDDGYDRDRLYARPRIPYENGDDRPMQDDRHHPSKRHKTDRSPSPRRTRSRSPSRTPPSVHDSPSESGTPKQPYKEKSILDARHVKELEERVRSRRVSRDDESMRNGAASHARHSHADRSALPPPPHPQHQQHYPPPPPSHLPPPPAFVTQAGFPPPPPPPAPHPSFLRPEPIHAPPHTAVPAGSRPASQPSDSINPSPAVGAPAPSATRDNVPTPIAPQPSSSGLHAELLPLHMRSNRSVEELWVREMNDTEVDELVARARADSKLSTPQSVERKYVGCSHISEYSLNEKLGEGTFGVVWKGMRGRGNAPVSAVEAEKEKEEEEKLVKVGLRVRKGDVVALKQIIFHNEGDGLPITSVREIRILKMLDHPNVVPVVDIAYEPGDAQNFTLGKTFMVFPYMDHDLAGLLENPRVKLETGHIKQYSKQLLEGTAYLHRNRILHRDMKAANLLISNKGQLMIADFGLARSIEAFEKNVEYTSCVVTRWYRPPELLLGEKRYHTPVDMWGVGCIMAEMWHRSPIFPGSSDMDQAVRIFASCGPPTDETMPGWRNLPGVEGHETVTWTNNGRSVRADWAGKANDDLFGDLMDRILVLDPKKRLTANEALDHDWFWTEPFPCDPSRMPTYEASHELDRRKRVQDQHTTFGQPVQQMQQPMHPRPVMPGYGNGPSQQPYPNQHAPAPFNGPPAPAAFNGPPFTAYNAPPMPMPKPYNAPAPTYGGGGGGLAGGGGGPHRSYAAAGPPIATVGARPTNGGYEPMRPSWQSQQARPYGAPPAAAAPNRPRVINLKERLAKK